ncbi:response regulator [Paenibacillus sp. D2_2]|uniref:response regulator n=1 Tax=Paenibacillus sp. D2_2 TaxID=3073092 RepID=UPI0028154A83|nr:response regulator [Paenibacillus sp. D2_2]WMT43135.1 response regulator [Paenibacillus sp. D2_2]
MKIKVLLVDDEPWVIESLRASIDWNTLGFEVVGTANSGTEAISMLEILKPDVVFTDIRMPGMSGLELVKRGKIMAPGVDYILISGYAEFAYAQKAISYGAIAYCLKPFDEAEIESILIKLRRERSSHQIGASDASIDNETMILGFLEEPDEVQMLRLLNRLEDLSVIRSPGDSIGVIVLASPSVVRPGLPEPYLYAKIGRTKHLFLVPYYHIEELISYIEERRIVDLPVSEGEGGLKIYGVGVTERSAMRTDLRRAVKEANELADQYFIHGGFIIARKQPSMAGSFKDLLKQVDEVMRVGDMARIHRIFDKLSLLFHSGSLTVQHALQLHHIVNAYLYCFKLDYEEHMLYSREQLLTSYDSVQEMLQDLRQCVAGFVLHTQDKEMVQTSNETFRAILSYVNNHFTEDVSIQLLSKQYYTNPSYISQLFKKEIGETFTAYIAKLRIAYACELLRGTNLLVGEIAEKSGYMDYFYFTRMFKKFMGKTRPSLGQNYDTWYVFFLVLIWTILRN